MAIVSEVFEKAKREIGFENYTQKFYDFLRVPESELFQGSKKERIKQFPIIIEGVGGIGKTTLIENVIHAIKKWYGEKNCNALYTKEFPLGILLNLAFKGFPELGWDAKKPVQILVWDDATSVTVYRHEQRQFFSIRHLMSKMTGLTEGIVYTIFATHEWYRLSTVLRRSAFATCFLSVPPLDTYSRRGYAQYVGWEGVKELASRFVKAIKFDKYKGVGLVCLAEEPPVGRIFWKNDVNTSYWKLEMTPEETEPYVDAYKQIIKYHPTKEEQKEMMTKEKAQADIEHIRKLGRERQRKYQERKKKLYKQMKIT